MIAATSPTSTWANERLSHGIFGSFLSNKNNPSETWFTWFNEDSKNYHNDVNWYSDLRLPNGNLYYLNLAPGFGTKLGNILHFGKMYTFQLFGASRDFRNINDLFHLFGDPEAEMILHPPATLTVSHPELVKAGETITITTGGNENGLQVCLYNEAIFGQNKRGLLQTTTNGQADFTLNNIGIDVYGDIKVTITGFGIRPYLGEMKLLPRDLYIQNKTINISEDFFAWRNIFAGPNVQIISPADVTFVAGQNIYLKPGFEARNGSKFWAYIDELLYNP